MSKREKKVGDGNYYKKHDTKRRGKGENIDLRNKLAVKFACYMIATKTMRHYTKGECTLDTISVVEHCI